METKLSEAEWLIMQYFWDNGPLKTDALHPLAASRGWKPTTLLTFLSRLVAKGMLAAEKQGKTNLYTPLVSRTEYQRTEGTAFLNELYGGSAKNFLAAMVNSRGLTSTDLADLKQWLEEQEVSEDE